MRFFSKHLPSTRALQCFVAVAEELNFRRASERLHMSQPPLSRQIRGLETLLGVQLVARSRQPVRLTLAGEEFRRQAHAVLVALEAASSGMRAHAERSTGAALPIRLGITSVIDASFIPRIQRLLRHPRVVEGEAPVRATSRLLVEQLRRGQLDLAIVGDLVAEPANIELDALGTEPMVVALPATHAAAALERVRLADLGDTPLFWFPRADNPAFFDKCERAFRRLGYAPPRKAEPADFTHLLAAVAEGEGVAFCAASRQAASRLGVMYRPFEAAIARYFSIDMGLAWRSAEARSEVLGHVAWIRSVLATDAA